MKKLALLMALLICVLPVTVNAVTPRYIVIIPAIDFDGTTAICTASVTGNSMTDEIEIVAKLWEDGSCIATWRDSGTGYLHLRETKGAEYNSEYTLTVDVTINGIDQPTKSFIALCE